MFTSKPLKTLAFTLLAASTLLVSVGASAKLQPSRRVSLAPAAASVVNASRAITKENKRRLAAAKRQMSKLRATIPKRGPVFQDPAQLAKKLGVAYGAGESFVLDVQHMSRPGKGSWTLNNAMSVHGNANFVTFETGGSGQIVMNVQGLEVGEPVIVQCDVVGVGGISVTIANRNTQSTVKLRDGGPDDQLVYMFTPAMASELLLIGESEAAQWGAWGVFGCEVSLVGDAPPEVN